MFVLLLTLTVGADANWPPNLAGARNGTVTLATADFLKIPAEVKVKSQDEKAAKFTVAKTLPTVDLAFHDQLGEDAVNRRLWSSWGDICVASDGRVYCAIGDHGNAVGGDARCFIYCWEPQSKTLRQIVDMNKVVPPRAGQPAWSKVHAKIDEGPGGKILFNCTLNDGNRARNPEYGWTDDLPGGQIYQYDPKSGETSVFANLPPRRCSATSIVDQQRMIWWCNLEAGEGNALWGLDLKTKEVVYQSHDGLIAFNRNFALANDGSIYFNGEDAIWKFDPSTQKSIKTKSSFNNTKGMRSSSRESKDGAIYGTTHQTNQLFRYEPAKDKLTMLGTNWLLGQYTTVCVLSPDERFLYYMPGSHGKAYRDGTPVVQYEIKTGTQKVIAFLAPSVERELQYVPSGSYGVKMSADGGTLYVNFNGHAADTIRPEKMRPNGFGLCAFAAIHIPDSERLQSIEDSKD